MTKDKTASQMGKRNRRHGLQFERDMVNILKSWRFPSCRRWLENHREDAAKGIDMVGTGKLLIQCKSYQKYPNINKIEEVQPVKGHYPALLAKGLRKRPTITMYFDDFREYCDHEGYPIGGSDD